jgi:hypothetical protein
MISARTKAALAAAKRRGVKLGGDRGFCPRCRTPRRIRLAPPDGLVLRLATDLRRCPADLGRRGRRLADPISASGHTDFRGPDHVGERGDC